MSAAELCAFCDPEQLEGRRLSDPNNPFMLSVLSDPKLNEAVVHALVMPRRHVEPGKDSLNPKEVVAINGEVERLRSLMLGGLAVDGVDEWQKTRPSVPEGHNGTKVHHHHTHVLGSTEGSELYSQGIIWGSPSRFEELNDEEAAKWVTNLRFEQQYGNR